MKQPRSNECVAFNAACLAFFAARPYAAAASIAMAQAMATEFFARFLKRCVTNANGLPSLFLQYCQKC